MFPGLNLNLSPSQPTPTQATVLELLSHFFPLPPMAAPLILANLESDDTIKEFCRQILEREGDNWEVIRGALEKVASS